MGLTSLFKRRGDAGQSALPVGDQADAVQQARIRARRRLIGATLLVGIGIIGFPLVFETQPRPIPVDIPIEVPRKDGMPPLVMPPARQPATVAIPPVLSNPEPARETAKPTVDGDAGEVITESREAAGRPTPPASAVSPSTPTPPAAKTVVASRKDAAPDDGARARALLDGKVAAAGTTSLPSVSATAVLPSGSSPEAPRYVVQVGAFADASAARETRLKAEQLGLKTYTQVASTAAGNRIRVRVGPFGTRDEAEKALSKARSAGLTAVVLTL